WPQLHGGGVVCAAPDQRRVRGLDCRAQDAAEHDVLSARVGRLSLVRAPTEAAAHGGRCAAVRPGADGQAASDYPAFRATSLGLLAAAPDVRPADDRT